MVLQNPGPWLFLPYIVWFLQTDTLYEKKYNISSKKLARVQNIVYTNVCCDIDSDEA